MSTVPLSFSLTLPRDPGASPLARDAIDANLGEVLPPRTLSDLHLAVSELVANAVVHGEGRIELRMQVDGDIVRGEVIDEGGGFEYELREEGFEDLGGRGLYLVGAVSSGWGVHEGTTHVWFEIPVEGAVRNLEHPELGDPGDERKPDA